MEAELAKPHLEEGQVDGNEPELTLPCYVEFEADGRVAEVGTMTTNFFSPLLIRLASTASMRISKRPQKFSYYLEYRWAMYSGMLR